MTKQDKTKAEKRRADALRANLRRRKSGDAAEINPSNGAKEPVPHCEK